MHSATPSLSPFGRSLRHWRRVRGHSQLRLALAADTTARHISFLETGRSRPSRAMVERLADALGVPLRERNAMLEAAGLRAAYDDDQLEAADLAPFRTALDRLLTQHEPFPGIVFDRHWTIVDANAAASALLAGTTERNGIRLTYGGAWRQIIDNWADVAWYGIGRIQDDLARFPDDPCLRELLEFALASLDGVPRPHEPTRDRVVCPRFRVGDAVIKTITVVARFGSPRHVTLDELRVELIYPADSDAEAFFVNGSLGLRHEGSL